MKEKVTIGYDIYEKENWYNRDEFYNYVEDNNGELWKAHYGHDGDQDYYITCFENVNTGDLEQGISETYYYKHIGRVPYKPEIVINIDSMVGKILEKEIIEGKLRYGFKDYDNNIFYVLK